MFKSLRQTIDALQKKQISSVELTTHYLQRIEQYKDINAYISVNEEALSWAKKADERLHQGQASLLTGVPMAHKDVFCTQGIPTTCGSKMLANFPSPYNATIVEKLAKEGCVLLGKTNMDEFAMGSTNENSYFGPVKNPWDNTCVSGGSSGGSAAAVAARLAAFTTGSDTGGSIRQPAAFCGISGIKPTYGLISRFGMVAYASSLDQAGPMAHSAEDLAIILQAMVGFDPKDSTSINQKAPDYVTALNTPLKGMRIGLPACFFQENVETDIQNSIHQAITLFEQAGAEIIKLDLALQDLWVACYYLIACAEASSNLARFDGVRYGYRSAKATSLKELISASRSEGLGPEVKRRILTGTYVLSSGYFDAYYIKALKVRRLIQEELLQNLNKVDFLLGPTTPSCAFKIGSSTKDPLRDYLADVFTVAVNLAGLPALSIPTGFSGNLPIGMQLIGKPFGEATLLSAAHQYQQLTDWHQLTPF